MHRKRPAAAGRHRPRAWRPEYRRTACARWPARRRGWRRGWSGSWVSASSQGLFGGLGIGRGLGRIIGEVGRQPALHPGQIHVLAAGLVDLLVALDEAAAEVDRKCVVERKSGYVRVEIGDLTII